MMKQRILNLKVEDLFNAYNEKRLEISFELNKDMIIERQEVWDIRKKSFYIHSILIDLLLMPFVFVKKINFNKKDNDEFLNNEYAILDGKQRAMALIQYINNEFPLDDLTPDVKTVEIKGLYFSDLSKRLKDKLLSADVVIYENEGTFEENIDAFIRYNGGIPPKPIELFRAKLGLHSKLLNYICDHDLFKLINLNGTKRFQDYELALYLLMIESNKKIGLSKDEKELFVDKLSRSKRINKNAFDNLILKLDYLEKAFNREEYINLNGTDKYLKKSHLVAIYSVLNKALSNNLSEEDFFKWANDFFYLNKGKHPKYWTEVSRGSTTSKSSIKIRTDEVDNSFKEYLKEIKINNNKVVQLKRFIKK